MTWLWYNWNSITGVRKGGTRALLEMLTLHPSIRMAAQEVHFFDNETNYARGYSWYLNQMPNLGPKQMAVEKSPSYLVTPGVAERIRAMDPSVHLLMIVREPVTRLVSDFTQITFNRLEKGLQTRTFDETIIRSDGTVNVDYYGVDTGLYSSHLERWYQHFPREQVRKQVDLQRITVHLDSCCKWGPPYQDSVEGNLKD